MTKAYIFAKISPGKENQVLQSFKEIEEVKHSQLLFGEHDAIIEIEVKQHEDLKRIMLDKVRQIEGLQSTKTYLTLQH